MFYAIVDCFYRSVVVTDLLIVFTDLALNLLYRNVGLEHLVGQTIPDTGATYYAIQRTRRAFQRLMEEIRQHPGVPWGSCI